ncbi:hypothetical protein MNBD_DELTA01-1782 [hydrothermal vent metagenome]|uniref:Uncharacterized protein n=1 Tax=hydrothermal vent metagenome TaxID=652676 RepID=A0A3B0R036_9ZZZZ
MSVLLFENRNSNLKETMNARVIRLFTDAAGVLPKDISSKMTALILTGSIARGEGSFMRTRKGRVSLLGDVEFLLVAKDPAQARALAGKVEHIFSDILRGIGIEPDLDVGSVTPEYFKNLKPHIFAVELKVHGKVLVGDRSILALIPDFDAGDIPRWDGLHLLFNRMVEHMKLYEGLLYGDARDIQRANYMNLKLTLDLGGSLLVFQNNYKPTYRERAELITGCVQSIADPQTRSGLASLPEDVRYWTSVKFNPVMDEVMRWNGDESKIEVFRSNVHKRFLEIKEMMKVLWIWEMNHYLELEWTNDPHKLINRYRKSEGLRLRLRGWAKWIVRNRRSGKGIAQQLLLLKTFRKGSPRTLIYACAALLYFSIPDAAEGSDDQSYKENFKAISGLLPAASISPRDNWFAASKRVVNAWQEHVKNG